MIFLEDCKQRGWWVILIVDCKQRGCSWASDLHCWWQRKMLFIENKNDVFGLSIFVFQHGLPRNVVVYLWRPWLHLQKYAKLDVKINAKTKVWKQMLNLRSRSFDKTCNACSCILTSLSRGNRPALLQCWLPHDNDVRMQLREEPRFRLVCNVVKQTWFVKKHCNCDAQHHWKTGKHNVFAYLQEISKTKMRKTGVQFPTWRDVFVSKTRLLLQESINDLPCWWKQILDIQNQRLFQEFPATAIIFCGSLLTLVFGVLNLIVAVASSELAAGTFSNRMCEIDPPTLFLPSQKGPQQSDVGWVKTFRIRCWANFCFLLSRSGRCWQLCRGQAARCAELGGRDGRQPGQRRKIFGGRWA